MHLFPGQKHLVTVCSLSLFCSLTWAGEQSIVLRERFAVGYEYRVQSRVELSGKLTLPAEKGKAAPKPLRVVGRSAIDYEERILGLDKQGQVRKTARLCRRSDFHRTVGERPQESSLRPAVRRLILLRRKNKEVPFSPDGPLMWGEIDLIRTDVFTPALTGLLPDRAVRVGERWTATPSAVRELTDLERIDEGSLTCRLEQIVNVENRRQAHISFRGTIRGGNEDGPNRQELNGIFYFDLESNHLSYLCLNGKHSMLDKDGKEVGHIEGRFVLTRQAHTRCRELSDAALKGITTEPNSDNTRMLYDNPSLGVRFLCSRRWHVAAVSGAQVALDGADGSGLLLTLDPPNRAATGEKFQKESRAWLVKQKARLLHVGQIENVRSSPILEHFTLQAEMNKQKFTMDYYVTRQNNGGATLAARLPAGDLPRLQKEVRDIAESVVITRRQIEKATR